MSKTAVIISGQMRTFATCVHTLRHHVFRHFPDADFYISTVQDKDTRSIDELRKLYPTARIETDIKESQPVLPEPAEPVRFEPYARSVPVQSVLRQLWQLNEGWRLLLDREDISTYDTFLRVRPDSFFHSFRLPAYHHADANRALTPWWGRFGGINDRFSVLGKDAAAAYFTTYSAIPMLMEYGCPLHPESLVKASIESHGCHVWDRLRAEFSTLKHDGARPPEITSIDLAHMTASG